MSARRCNQAAPQRRAFARKREGFLFAWLAATLLSGLPSTLYALASNSDALQATRAAAAMFPLSGNVFVDAALVHTSVSLFWAAILSLALPRTNEAAWSIGAATLIGLFDLRVIAPRFFPEVAALEFWPQMADHLMWGACFGLVLQFRRRRRAAPL